MIDLNLLATNPRDPEAEHQALLRLQDSVVRQSDLASFSYCAQQQQYRREDEAAGVQAGRLSATIFGSVMHYALETLQRLAHQGDPSALDTATATFRHYWDPAHTAEICEGPPTIWAARQTYGGLLSAGQRALTEAYDWMTKGAGSKDILLATEYTFDIPIVIDGVHFTLHGTIDRLALRIYNRLPVLAIDDWKSGIKPDHLQHAMQWTVYSYATQHPAFWTELARQDSFDEVERRVNSRGLDLYVSGEEGLEIIEKRGRWLSVKNGQFSVHEAGHRTQQHFNRMKVAIKQYLLAQAAGLHPLTMDTKKCVYCPYAAERCGGAPMPEFQDGIDVVRYQ